MEYEEEEIEETQVEGETSHGQHLLDADNGGNITASGANITVNTSSSGGPVAYTASPTKSTASSPAKGTSRAASPLKPGMPIKKTAQQLPSVAKDMSAFVVHLLNLLSETHTLSEDQLEQWMKRKLKPLCIVDSHNFLFIQALLKQLSTEWQDGVHVGFPVIRILEELQTLSASKQEAQMLADVVRYSGDLPLDVVTSLINIQSAGTPTAGDIMKLHRAYKSSSPPPVELLRSLPIMHALISNCFSPGRSNNYREEKLWLLAYSSSAVASGPDGSSVSCSAVMPLFDQLMELDNLLVRVTSMAQIHPQLLKFFTAIDEPILSMGLLHWIKERLFDPDFYEWISFTLGDSPPVFHILDEMAIRNPEQRPHVFATWKMLFEKEYPKVTPLVAIQFRERFLDHFILLIKTGYVEPVFSYLSSNTDKIDDSLLLLTQIELPNDRYYSWLIIELMQLVSTSSLHEQAAITQFLEHTNRPGFLSTEQTVEVDEILERLK
ncbi:hypothetical protein BASA61_010286 [Batrachochytrium salamandrivorans]|nr:hypothetical protein BASA61_010286 [Batrachochytrium salamandrivorans]